ncbi:MAG: hypothetical protein AAFX58_08290, partial [Pseudomonadota bacterium]
MGRPEPSEPFLIELLIRCYSWFVQELNVALEASNSVRLTRAQITAYALENPQIEAAEHKVE